MGVAASDRHRQRERERAVACGGGGERERERAQAVAWAGRFPPNLLVVIKTEKKGKVLKSWLQRRFFVHE